MLKKRIEVAKNKNGPQMNMQPCHERSTTYTLG